MSDYGHSAWAEEARTRKAVALEVALSGQAIPADAVREWDGQQWRVKMPAGTRSRIEKAAGVRKSSDETWLRAAELLADYEATRERMRDAHT